MADQLDQLYWYIVRTFALEDDLIDIDLNAKASGAGDSLDSAKQTAVGREQSAANELAPYFRSGIAKAQTAGSNEIALCDQDPIEDRQADALIRYLVSYGLASSRSAETPPGYTYHLTVNWDKLRDVADKAGLDFDTILASVR